MFLKHLPKGHDKNQNYDDRLHEAISAEFLLVATNGVTPTSTLGSTLFVNTNATSTSSMVVMSATSVTVEGITQD